MACHFNARFSLYLLIFIGFMVNYIHRADLNIFILQILNPELFPWEDVCYDKQKTITFITGAVYNWTSTEICCILGSYYWTYPFAQLPGVVAMNKIGVKYVFGVSTILSSMAKIAFPFLCGIDLTFAIVCRAIEGFLSGIVRSAASSVMQQWVPVKERMYFTSCNNGQTVGIGFTYLFYGVALNFIPWEYMCFVSGGLGITWSIFWFSFTFDSPNKHKLITQKERDHIIENIEPAEIQEFCMQIPWLNIICCRPVLATGLATFGRMFVYNLLVIYLPMYYTFVFGRRLERTGLLVGIPFLIFFIVGESCLIAARRLIQNDILSTTSTRKLFTGICQIGPAIILIMLSYTECQEMYIVILWTLAIICSSTWHAGANAIPGDIGSNFEATIYAYMQTINMLGGILVHFIVAYYTQEDHTYTTWRHILYWSAGLSSTTFIIFLFGADASEQYWNDYERYDSERWDMNKQTSGIDEIIDAWQYRTYRNSRREAHLNKVAMRQFSGESSNVSAIRGAIKEKKAAELAAMRRETSADAMDRRKSFSRIRKPNLY